MVGRTVWRCFSAALMLLALLACATVVRPVEMFPASNEDFAKRLRWLDYSGAAQHMAESVRGDFLERFADNEDLRVVDFDIERVEFRADGRKVIVWHVLEYYMLPSATVKKERIQLEWEFREENKLLPGTWSIISEFPRLP
ncbi:hypothetical protein [Trichloromonas sp.]|uniref:hypothetical protein n=1 Tax=Trichloromonas sp. TaxID=3069249 RepID=UPI003D8155E8